MPAFGNPVNGIIAPRGAARTAGQFVVTSTFAEHVASGRGPGVDIGDGRCGSPLIAMCTGIVTETLTFPNGANAVRYRSLDYPSYEPAIAHMPSIEVKVGQLLVEGQTIGHVGTSGAVACHCHGGMRRNGVEIDWWPLLRQNGAKEDTGLLKGTYVQLLDNRIAKVASLTANFRDGVTTTSPIIGQYPQGLPVHPVVQVNGQAVAGEATWFGCFLYVDAAHGYQFGYFHGTTLSPLVKAEAPVATGFTQAQVDAAIAAAIKPLNTKITSARAALA